MEWIERWGAYLAGARPSDQCHFRSARDLDRQLPQCQRQVALKQLMKHVRLQVNHREQVMEQWRLQMEKRGNHLHPLLGKTLKNPRHQGYMLKEWHA